MREIIPTGANLSEKETAQQLQRYLLRMQCFYGFPSAAKEINLWLSQCTPGALVHMISVLNEQLKERSEMRPEEFAPEELEFELKALEIANREEASK